MVRGGVSEFFKLLKVQICIILPVNLSERVEQWSIASKDCKKTKIAYLVFVVGPSVQHQKTLILLDTLAFVSSKIKLGEVLF